MNLDKLFSGVNVKKSIQEVPLPLLKSFWWSSSKKETVNCAGYDQFTFTEVDQTSAIHLFINDLLVASLSVPEGSSTIDWKIALPVFLRNGVFSFTFAYRESRIQVPSGRIQPRIFAQMWTISEGDLKFLQQEHDKMIITVDGSEVWLRKDTVVGVIPMNTNSCAVSALKPSLWDLKETA